MDKDQLRSLIVRVLKGVDLYSDSAVELLMLTAATESKLGYYIKQLKGPALGIFQMEPTTEKDIWNNYLNYKPDLYREVSYYSLDLDKELEFNLAYAIIMARIHYLRVPKALPKIDDVIGLASYWKEYYNTRLGKGTVDKAVREYTKYAL